MAILASLMAQFTEWTGGPRLISGDLLKKLARSTVGAKGNVVALAGGTLTAATPVLGDAFINLSVVASANDSVALPAAIPGTCITIANNGAQTAAIFAQTSNPQNGGVADKIIAQGGTAQVASVTQAVGTSTEYFCAAIGIWQAK